MRLGWLIKEAIKAPLDALLVLINTLLFVSIIFTVITCRFDNRETGPRKRSILQYNGEFCVSPFIRQSLFKSAEEIFLVLHATIDQIDESMMRQFATWTGAIVLNVLVDAYSPKVEMQTLTEFQAQSINKINYLLAKYEIINIDVHFTFQIPLDERQMSCADYSVLAPSFDHDPLNIRPVDSSESPMLTEDNWYPINVLRNSARLFIPKTRLMTLSDSEFLFSFNFETAVAMNVEAGAIDLSKDLMVYRIFEGIPDEELGYPLDKQELKSALVAQTVRLFHEETALESHWIPDLQNWLNTTTLNGTITYRYTDAAWEPQFVSQNTVPFHDEAFPYLIRDNANQRWELCRAGYNFKVLNGAFAIHPGFKSKEDGRVDQEDRTVVLARYAQAVNNFNSWMNVRYPKTRKKCPRMESDDKSRRALEDRKMLEMYSSAERKQRIEQMQREKEEEERHAAERRQWKLNVEILRAIKMGKNPKDSTSTNSTWQQQEAYEK